MAFGSNYGAAIPPAGAGEYPTPHEETPVKRPKKIMAIALAASTVFAAGCLPLNGQVNIRQTENGQILIEPVSPQTPATEVATTVPGTTLTTGPVATTDTTSPIPPVPPSVLVPPLPTSQPPTTTSPVTEAPTTARLEATTTTRRRTTTTAPPTTQRRTTTTAPPTTQRPTTTTAPPTTKAPATADSRLDRAEAESYRLLNELRADLGLSALQRNTKMDAFARDWSRTMAASGDFRHSNGPYGENIVWHSSTRMTPEQAAKKFHDMWVNSPGHYRNMTHSGYRLVGVGLYYSERGWHGTHVFAR